MLRKRLGGQDLEFDDEGFLVDGSVWTPTLAEQIARNAGLSTLTQKHWTVLTFCREDAAIHGRPPSLRRIAEGSGCSLRELHELFPGNPNVLAARIAGLSSSGLSL